LNIAFVPVRCGSKSIPYKNIKLFSGKPLVYWVLKSLQDTINLDKIILATDCIKIKSICESFNFSKLIFYDRKLENATDLATTESVILEYLKESKLDKNDLFILVQATSPFTKSKHFEEGINQFYSEKADSLLSCVLTKRFFWTMDAHPLNYDYISRPRRQDYDGLYLENGAFYINTVKGILKYKNRLGGNVSIYRMPEYTSIEIDEPEDWAIAENLFKNNNKDINLKKIKLFFSDVDGTITDAGMYYDQLGNELKKFNTHDGKGFELLRDNKIKSGIITSEITDIVKNRAKKLKIDYLYQGATNQGKLNIIKEVCIKENLTLDEVAYIGDDINCKELLEQVGLAACPSDAQNDIKMIPGIIILNKSGGQGAVRELINLIITRII
jgi:N-acylneuraminate cytidylyltransferase